MTASNRKLLFTVGALVLTAASGTLLRVYPQAPELAVLASGIAGLLGGKEHLRGSKPNPGEAE